jgi:hypothetical protein
MAASFVIQRGIVHIPGRGNHAVCAAQDIQVNGLNEQNIRLVIIHTLNPDFTDI